MAFYPLIRWVWLRHMGPPIRKIPNAICANPIIWFKALAGMLSMHLAVRWLHRNGAAALLLKSSCSQQNKLCPNALQNARTIWEQLCCCNYCTIQYALDRISCNFLASMTLNMTALIWKYRTRTVAYDEARFAPATPKSQPASTSWSSLPSICTKV